MAFILNIAGQVGQISLSPSKALWPLFETVVNSIQSLEDTDIADKRIVIDALRNNDIQTETDSQGNIIEAPSRFEEFIVTDNGNGFNTANYNSFLEAYSQLKVKKGCKGIGRFLWLKAFDTVSIDSIYQENGQWYNRSFDFTLQGIPDGDNFKEIETEPDAQKTVVWLKGFKGQYRDVVAYSLESLAKKLIEHCLPYFIMGTCPEIILQDNRNEVISLNNYYEKIYKDSLHRDSMPLKGQNYTLYHMLIAEGADRHELHLCANNREVKSFDLSKLIPNMQKKLITEDMAYYYVGYLAGEYLDATVNTERSDFNFEDRPLLNTATEPEIIATAIGFIRLYLHDDLSKVADEKRQQIDSLVQSKRPIYRLLLNRNPSLYDEIPAGLSEEKLDLELYKHQQKWELETAEKRIDIEAKVKEDATSDPSFQALFDEYCQSITDLSRASLAEYVAKRKAVIDLLNEAIEADEEGEYSRESRIHKIICPMQTTSDEIKLDDMNLWLIDDRLAYHHFLASDKVISSIPLLESTIGKRMDLAVFDAALSYTADPDNINSITIVELKRPQRNDSDNDPVWQVLKYVRDIKAGRIKKANGRDFGNMDNVSFYCYVVGDLTQSMRDSAARSGLTKSQDKEGYFGYIPEYGAYVEVISYDKLVKDAKQRNRALFDKLFIPKATDLYHPELLN